MKVYYLSGAKCAEGRIYVFQSRYDLECGKHMDCIRPLLIHFYLCGIISVQVWGNDVLRVRKFVFEICFCFIQGYMEIAQDQLRWC